MTAETLTATTNEAVTFSTFAAGSSTFHEVPAGTFVTLDAYEMEENPACFRVHIEGCEAFAYVALDEITPA